MSELPPCNQKVFREGTLVGTYGDCIPEVMEMACKEASKITGQLTDWNFHGGHAVVKTLGDSEIVHELLETILLRGSPMGCLRVDDERILALR